MNRSPLYLFIYFFLGACVIGLLIRKKLPKDKEFHKDMIFVPGTCGWVLTLNCFQVRLFFCCFFFFALFTLYFRRTSCFFFLFFFLWQVPGQAVRRPPMPFHRFSAGDVVAITLGSKPPSPDVMEQGDVVDAVVLQRLVIKSYSAQNIGDLDDLQG